MNPTLSMTINADHRQVRRLQQALTVAGYATHVDGHFDHSTYRQVCAVQSANGLDVNGVAGPSVWAALAPAPAVVPKPEPVAVEAEAVPVAAAPIQKRAKKTTKAHRP
jgi:peptidoglycan hydrolase-like protein with peptidoglycan-binding domain